MFVRGTRYTSVPNALLGPLLAQIDSLAELKCVLRVLGLIARHRSQRPWVTLEELLTDPVLLEGLAQQEDGAPEAARAGVALAVERGTLLQVRHQGDAPESTFILINDEQGRRAAQRLDAQENPRPLVESPNSEGPFEPRPNIFVLYEENIGPLTPLLAEELTEAEATYPWAWIREAFREAVDLQKRNWRYISRILERWAVEGNDHGKPGGYSQETDPKEYGRRYGHLRHS